MNYTCVLEFVRNSNSESTSMDKPALDQLNLRVNCVVVWNANAVGLSSVSVEATRALFFHPEGGSQTSVVFNGTGMTDSHTAHAHAAGQKLWRWDILFDDFLSYGNLTAVTTRHWDARVCHYVLFNLVSSSLGYLAALHSTCDQCKP